MRSLGKQHKCWTLYWDLLIHVKVVCHIQLLNHKFCGSQRGSFCQLYIFYKFVITWLWAGWVGVWHKWSMCCISYAQDGSACVAGDVYFVLVKTGWVGVCRWWCIFRVCYDKMGRRVALVMYILCLLWQDGSTCVACDVYFVFVMTGWVGVCRWWCIFCVCCDRMGRRVLLLRYILFLLWQDGSACVACDVYFVFVMTGWVGVWRWWCIFCVCCDRMGRRVLLVMYILCLLWQDGTACVACDVYFVFVMTGWVGVCCLWCIFFVCYDRMGRRVLLVMYILCLLWQDGTACVACDVCFVFVMTGWVGVWRWWCIFCFCYDRMGRRVLLVMYILFLLWQDGSACVACDVYFVFVMTGWVGVCCWWCIFCVCYDRMGRRVSLVMYVSCLLWQDGTACGAGDVYFVFVMTGWVDVCCLWCIFCACYDRMGRRVLLVMYILCLLWQDGSACVAGDVYFVFVMTGWDGVCRLWCMFRVCYDRMGRRVALVMYILCLLWQDGSACVVCDVYFVLVMTGWVGVCCLWCIFCVCYDRTGRRVLLVMYILCLLWQDGTACVACDVCFVFVMTGWDGVWRWWCIFCFCYDRMGRRVLLVMYILCLLWQGGSACVACDVYFVLVMGRCVALVMYILFLLWQDGSTCVACDVYFVFLWQDGSACVAGDVYFVFVMTGWDGVCCLWGIFCFCCDRMGRRVLLVMYILCLLFQDGSACGAGDVYFVFVMAGWVGVWRWWCIFCVCYDRMGRRMSLVIYVSCLLWQDVSACGAGDVYLAPAVTVGETEEAMDSTSVFFWPLLLPITL